MESWRTLLRRVETKNTRTVAGKRWLRRVWEYQRFSVGERESGEMGSRDFDIHRRIREPIKRQEVIACTLWWCIIRHYHLPLFPYLCYPLLQQTLPTEGMKMLSETWRMHGERPRSLPKLEEWAWCVAGRTTMISGMVVLLRVWRHRGKMNPIAHLMLTLNLGQLIYFAPKQAALTLHNNRL